VCSCTDQAPCCVCVRERRCIWSWLIGCGGVQQSDTCSACASCHMLMECCCAAGVRRRHSQAAAAGAAAGSLPAIACGMDRCGHAATTSFVGHTVCQRWLLRTVYSRTALAILACTVKWRTFRRSCKGVRPADRTQAVSTTATTTPSCTSAACVLLQE
jgi:hypothetical protein